MELKITSPVAVTGGKISGYQQNGVNIYKGIPYAAPPVGELRWKAPQPVRNWDGLLECTQWSKSPIQEEQKPFFMWTKEFIIEDTGFSEDCLYLNVWAPEDMSGKKPVIVFFHGGNLISGGPSCEVYDGQGIAEKGAVYVSVGFRVGVLGLLACTALNEESEQHVSGNYMLLDQIAALKWIRSNISAFGGDPDNITISGLSAGANNVNALSVSPLAKGLFKRAFAMSYLCYGNLDVIRPWGTLEELCAKGDALFEGKSVEEMREIPAETILKMPYPSNLCIDGYVLPSCFTEAVNAGATDDLDFIAGMVAGDGLAFKLTPFGTRIDEEKAMAIVKGFFGEYTEEALTLYPLNKAFPDATFMQMGHDAFLASMYLFADMRADRKAGNTFIYDFVHVMPGKDSAMFGAFHSSDMPYFWNIFSSERKDDWTAADYALGEKLCSALAAFAASGTSDEENGWKPYDGSGYCIINTQGCATAHMDEKKLDLWEKAITKKLCAE